MSIDVVYLAYYNEEANYTIKKVEYFFDSYSKNPAGIEHDLTVIAKNWTDKESYEKVCQLADKYNAKIIELPDDGWDIGAYFRVAELLTGDYALFLGSTSQIMCPNWLSKLYSAFEADKSIKMIGPMGSWGDSRGIVYPNIHIRTSAFMIDRKIFLEYISKQKFPVTKDDTYEIEHGDNSISQYVIDSGYKIAIVDDEGSIIEPARWPYSRTYRYPNCWKTLISDKLATYYFTVDDEHKEFLERAAWGQSLKENKIKIFASYSSATPIFSSEIYQPIFLNSNEFISAETALRDNIGALNISDKNSYYNDLTGHYWIWKNVIPYTEAEYIGFCQNFRYLDFNISTFVSPFQQHFIADFKKTFELYKEENILNCIDGFDIIVPFKIPMPVSVYQQFASFCDVKYLNLAIEVLNALYPEYSETAKAVIDGNELYMCLNFVMKRKLVNEYMEWIFNILNSLEQKIDLATDLDFINNKVPYYIAERFFNIWLRYNVPKKRLIIKEVTSLTVNFDMKKYLEHCMSTLQQMQSNNVSL